MIHANVATQAFVEARRRLLARRCPKCGLEQLTPEEMLDEPVPCEACGTPLPPKGKASAGGGEARAVKRDTKRGGRKHSGRP
jgi:hypothetical protein